jgi:glycosyltransferase involved in cell wall biosynthesis
MELGTDRMAHSDSPLSAAGNPIALRAAPPVAEPPDSLSEPGAGRAATVGGIPIASAILLPADHLHAQSAWNQHIPFAFWLIQAHAPSIFVELGTFRGTSYFSFCQAVAALRLPTRCFAVDTWQGDAHTGFYDESVFNRVNACNELKYAGFSRLVRSNFDEALPHFLDGSIDLLHIDGLHTYDACRHDFEAWLPKLSRRAIVLFHDTNVRERGFGVYRLWAELVERYPHFEFVHEHGLGVLGVGEAFDAPVRELFAAADDAALTCEVRSAFWRLAGTVRAEIGLQASGEERARLETRLSATTGEHEIEVSRLTAESARVHLALEEKERQAAELTAQCAAERREKAELGMALAEARSRNAGLDVALAAARGEKAELDTALAAARSRNTALDAALAAARGEKAELGTALAAARSENAELNAAFATARQEGADRQAALDEKATELAAVRIRGERAEAASAATRKELDAVRRSTSWKITQPLRRLGSARSRFAGHTARVVKRVPWIGLFGTRLPAHFLLQENIKLIAASGLFDRNWYLEQYPDVRASGLDPLVHYLKYGANEDRDPNPLFDTDWYLDRYPDVRAAGANPLAHYLQHGAAEGRNPSPLFDSDWYLAHNSDVRAAGVNPLAHYLRHGMAEGRDSNPSFDGNNLPVISHYFDAVSSVNVRRLFAFISSCPGDSYRYRCEHMTEILRNIGYTADALPPNVFLYDQLAKKYSIVVAHRVPWTLQFDDFTKQIRSSGGIIVYDVDDLVFDIQKVEQIDAYNRMSETEQVIYRDGVERYGRAMALCDAVTVSTEQLRDEVHRLHPSMHVTITRNKVSRTICSLAADARAHAESQRQFVTIAYFSGTRTHQRDFSVCDEALYRILGEFTTTHFMIVGYLELPERFAEFGSRVETVPFVPWEQLSDLYARTDINLAPLEYHNDFTASKSELKYLEAALLGVPTIASDLGAYRRSIINWTNGVLCGDSEEWYHAMRELSRDRELRRRIGEEAKRFVERCGTTLVSKQITQTEWRQLVASSSRARRRSQFTGYKPSIAFVVLAPIATTSGGYKKIFVLANYLKSRDYDVRVHVAQIAHLVDKSESEVRDYCKLYFGIDPAAVFVGHLGIDPVDVAIATNWPTASIVYDLDQVRAKLYFVQDFEPDFYTKEQPDRGMADATYDLGLSIITIGDYLKELLGSRGRLARSIPFGIEKCFHQAGQNRNPMDSAGSLSVLFFARPNIPRRNFSVGVEALAAIHRKYPEIQIRLYGLESVVELPFPYEHLGQLSQAQLAAEMARSDIHLSYSLTNVSSVIYEAMACGCACVEADVPSVRCMVREGENCVLTEPTASGTLESLDDLIKDQRLRQKVARSGYYFTRGLTEERMCKEFITHILECALVK